MKYNFTKFLLFLLLTGCAVSNQSADRAQSCKLVYSVNAGLNNGGIIENTDFSTATTIPVDAVTGATKMGFHVGGRVAMPLWNNAIESGLDVMTNNQIFKYNDLKNEFVGNRNIWTTQIMVPLTWNFGFFKKSDPLGMFKIKLGWVLQYNMLSVKDSDYQLPLPEYFVRSFSSGPTLGFSVTPFTFKNGSKLGVYFDAYRGSKIYDDFYNDDFFKMPGSSYLKYGILYQF
ncbi:MAG: hypothetical protein WCR42_05910 [bacterium]